MCNDEIDTAMMQAMVMSAALIAGKSADETDILDACGRIDWSKIDSQDIQSLKDAGTDLESYGYKS